MNFLLVTDNIYFFDNYFVIILILSDHYLNF